MPPLETHQRPHIGAPFRLDEATAAQVDQYAGHASADDVVDNAFNDALSKDRDFQEFLKTPHARQVAHMLRICKGTSKDAAERSAKRLASCLEPSAFVPATTGRILYFISGWCENGASHRKNSDTPPLEGSCRATLVAPLATTENRRLAETR